MEKDTITGATLSSILGTNSDFYIGMNPYNSSSLEYFQGYIDNFAVYDKAFNEEEVSAHFNAEKPEALVVPEPTEPPLDPGLYSEINSSAVSNATVNAYRVTKEIEADGLIDSTWGNIPYYEVHKSHKGSALPTSALAKARFAYDDDYFYVFVRVKDTVRDCSNSTYNSRFGSEIFFDEDTSENSFAAATSKLMQYYLVGVQNGGGAVVGSLNEGGTGDTYETHYGNVVTGYEEVSDGYIMEYKIPWRFKPTTVNNGSILFDLCVFICENGSKKYAIDLLTESGKHQHPELLGTVNLQPPYQSAE